MEPHSRDQSNSDPLFPNYAWGKKIGKGSFAKVFLAKHALTGDKVAVKIINLAKLKAKYVETARREVRILSSISHPHIIRLLEVVEKKCKLYLVTEYMDGGDLYDYTTVRERLKENEARYCFQQIISGVEFCHFNMVAHRDLKPENLLIDSKGNIKLADFGFSNVMLDGHFLKTSCGSPQYAAPEILSGKHYCGPEVDVWSCGVILFVLLCGRVPFSAELPTLCKTILEGRYTFPSYLSSGAMDLITRILVVDPMSRITISEIQRHPWFNTHLPQHLVLLREEMKKRQLIKIDPDILREVVNIGFNPYRVMESLRNGIQNQETVTYYLLLNKRSHLYTPQPNYRLNEGSVYESSNLYQQENISTANTGSLQGQSYQCGPTRYSPVRRNWALGLQSLGRPNDIMREVLTVIQRLSICWKSIGHYNMKCKWVPNLLSRPKIEDLDLNCVPSDESASDNTKGDDLRSQNTIKFEIQLYKSSGNNYLLDLQIVSGPPILFLELCHSLLALLRAI